MLGFRVQGAGFTKNPEPFPGYSFRTRCTKATAIDREQETVSFGGEGLESEAESAPTANVR